MSQCEKIMKFMETHGSITAKQAEKYIGCMRLASRIHDLREQGVKIKSEQITVRTRSGKTQVARYSLDE